MILKKQHGASAVEFAILLPFLVLLVFGLIDFGFLMYNQQVLTNASREGARAAIVGTCTYRLANTTDEQISQIVIDYCIDPDDPTKKRLITFASTNPDPVPDVNPSPSACTPGPGGTGLTVGDDVTVTVDWNYTFLLPSLLGYGPTKQLRANTVMKMESAP